MESKDTVVRFELEADPEYLQVALNGKGSGKYHIIETRTEGAATICVVETSFFHPQLICGIGNAYERARHTPKEYWWNPETMAPKWPKKEEGKGEISVDK